MADENEDQTEIHQEKETNIQKMGREVSEWRRHKEKVQKRNEQSIRI